MDGTFAFLCLLFVVFGIPAIIIGMEVYFRVSDKKRREESKTISSKKINNVKSLNNADLKFCPYCGSNIRIGAKFCDECGKELHNNQLKKENNVEIKNNQVPIQNSNAPQNKKIDLFFVEIGALVLLLVILVPITLYLLFGNNKNIDKDSSADIKKQPIYKMSVDTYKQIKKSSYSFGNDFTNKKPSNTNPLEINIGFFLGSNNYCQYNYKQKNLVATIIDTSSDCTYTIKNDKITFIIKARRIVTYNDKSIPTAYSNESYKYTGTLKSDYSSVTVKIGGYNYRLDNLSYNKLDYISTILYLPDDELVYYEDGNSIYDYDTATGENKYNYINLDNYTIYDYPFEKKINKSDRIQDYAKIFKDDEIEELNKLVNEYNKEKKTNFYIITINEKAGFLANTYVREFYEFNDLGETGVAFYVDMQDRKFDLVSIGNGMSKLKGDRYKVIESVRPYLTSGNYKDAIIKLINELNEM